LHEDFLLAAVILKSPSLRYLGIFVGRRILGQAIAVYARNFIGCFLGRKLGIMVLVGLFCWKIFVGRTGEFLGRKPEITVTVFRYWKIFVGRTFLHFIFCSAHSLIVVVGTLFSMLCSRTSQTMVAPSPQYRKIL
jgi:hypothetical protein